MAAGTGRLSLGLVLARLSKAPFVCVHRSASSGSIWADENTGGELAGRKVVVLDSSFNPPTLAHLNLLRKSTALIRFDAELLLLATENADKGLLGNDLEARVEMMQLLAREAAEFANDLGVGLIRFPRFIDKARILTASTLKGCEIYFLMGSDTLVRFFDNKYYSNMEADMNEFFQTCRARILFSIRAGHSEASLTSFLQKPEVSLYGDYLHRLDLAMSDADISSTRVRQLLQNRSEDVPWDAIRQLVPPLIFDHLRRRHRPAL